jgi:hypothetical protein
VVVSALRSESPCWSSFSHVLEDTRTLLQGFQSVEVHHIRRDANRSAHVLVKSALKFMLDQLWIGDAPSYIHSTILVEQSSFI